MVRRRSRITGVSVSVSETEDVVDPEVDVLSPSKDSVDDADDPSVGFTPKPRERKDGEQTFCISGFCATGYKELV